LEINDVHPEETKEEALRVDPGTLFRDTPVVTTLCCSSRPLVVVVGGTAACAGRVDETERGVKMTTVDKITPKHSLVASIT
jgi:hypothetical protein